MMEAWLLLDESAIRRAAGNPAGRSPLRLPAAKNVEDVPDPKTLLYDCLRDATELPPRRLRNFNPGKAVHRVSAYMDNFEPLLQLPAFRAFYERLTAAMAARPLPPS